MAAVADTNLEPHILARYNIIQLMGRGAYGIVWKAVDKKTQKIVAVKKVFDAFRNSTDAQRTYREASNDRDLYMVFEFMDTDLHHAIHCNLLQDVHQRFVIYQALKAILYLHSADVLHRDLKPSNILVGGDCVAKLCDFGLARSLLDFSRDSGHKLTDYVATRWYRAPEILLGSNAYTKGVDMWSMGCIIGEMFTCRALFPGTSTTNQLERILAITGHPSDEDVASLRSEYASTILQALQSTRRSSLQALVPRAPPLALDLLHRLLQWNPFKRLSAEDALQHPYLYDFHNPDHEPLSSEAIRIAQNDNVKRSVADYRNMIYADIRSNSLPPSRGEPE
eukprot:gnl/Spiro4/22942_TR11323_c0_g1_i1.p1 gnl/Spiro4/22942_TR11323_c0_g1~~gnl/Spiro4/22942_TR11323_c0_g1_i1.p1  ORF type:complete len:337 (-),score=112.27 gnl/Spiro4/22942_TR11323_c0_g1_i1:6-1016(-)